MLQCGVVVFLLSLTLGSASDTPLFTGGSAIYAGDRVIFSVVVPNSFGVISNILWTINGSTFDQFSDVNPVTANPTDLIRTLTLSNIPISYNNTEVQCTLDANAMSDISCGPAQIIRVQGLLDMILDPSLQYNPVDATLNISWTPPYALVVPLATIPERFYCIQIIYGNMVQVYGCNENSTSDPSEISTSFQLENIECGVSYTITITPYNRIGNGTESILQFPDAPIIMQPLCPDSSTETNSTFMIPVSGLVCNCSGRIVDTDATGTVDCDQSPGYLRVVVMAVTNERFVLEITAGNSRSMSSGNFDITTFDVCEVNITASTNSVDYSVEFVGDSNALGVLIILLFSVGGNLDFSRSVYFVQGRQSAEAMNSLEVIYNGTYEALAYDVEENGEITRNFAVNEVVDIPGQSTGNLSLSSFGSAVTCSSEIIAMQAVVVQCEFDMLQYSGFTAYLQSERGVLTFASTTKVNSSVRVNGTTDGQHFVFVYPVWRSNGLTSAARLRPAYERTVILSGFIEPTSPLTTMSPITSQMTESIFSTSGSFSGEPPVTGGISSNMAAIIGGAVAVIVIILLVIVLIVITLLWILKRRKNKTSVEVNDTSYMMEEKDRRSPSDPEMIAPVYETAPVFETARLPPPKVVSDSVKVNGDSSVPPPSDPAPDAPGPNVADLYSVVDKSRPQEQQYESVQLIKGTKKKVEDIHKVEYATLQHQDPQPPKENSEEPPPLPARPEGTEEPTRTYVRPVDCYEVLSGMAAEWKLLAEYLGMDEDDIDEVFTNNESDVACLNDFLSRICILSTKEDMSEALEKMGLMHESKAILTLPNRKLMEGQY